VEGLVVRRSELGVEDGGAERAGVDEEAAVGMPVQRLSVPPIGSSSIAAVVRHAAASAVRSSTSNRLPATASWTPSSLIAHASTPSARAPGTMSTGLASSGQRR
jgi:hypothetical protein